MASTQPSIGNYVRKKTIWFILILTSVVIAFPLITGKYGDEGVVNNIFIYIIGGFPYFDTVINESTNYTYTLSHTMYPLAKLMLALGLSENDISQISDFRDVPFPTNVGTFILPFIEDGGVLYVLLLTPVVIFLLDALAFSMLKRMSIMSLFIWANLIYVMIMAFFAARYASSAIYLFISTYFFLEIFNLFKDNPKYRVQK
jgi:oligosaccharide repeat unit polymerase